MFSYPHLSLLRAKCNKKKYVEQIIRLFLV